MLSRIQRFLWCLVFLCAAVPVFSREVILVIKDTELDIPLEGAVVRLADGREFSAAGDGVVRLNPADAETLTAQVRYPGYRGERVVIPPPRSGRVIVALRIESLLEGRELVFTAEREREQAVVETGRSVTLAGRELERTAQIGFLEDVMTSVKLLPGVGYTGMFNAMPSIRGGEPGDLVAVLDGFYIENPYFWGGGVSIFDPRMIESVKLSHGIFSTRYGHTTSGLLELTSKKAPPAAPEIDLGFSTSALNLNVSYPLAKGGFNVMGKGTYWGGYVELLKALSYGMEELEPIRGITTAPYINTAAFSGNYHLTHSVELTLNGFIGGDGIGADYANKFDINGRAQNINLEFLWDNLQGFIIGGVRGNPESSMLIKASIGGGFLRTLLDGDIHNDVDLENDITKIKELLENYYGLSPSDITALEALGFFPTRYTLDQHLLMNLDNSTYTAQGRVDYDWELSRALLFSAGVQEFYSRWTRSVYYNGPMDAKLTIPLPTGGFTGYVNMPVVLGPRESYNHALTSAAYTLMEYRTPARKFGAELGLRVDHLYLMGDGFAIQSAPAFNPRLNLDFNVLKNKLIFDSIDVTAGTGLFSSMTDSAASLNKNSGVGDFELKQNRSWTTLAGTKINFLDSWSFNIEGYYKYIFDRAYSISPLNAQGERAAEYYFDGESRVWGFDLMLQKFQSRYWDGWISYTFTHVRFRNPIYLSTEGEKFNDDDWRYPNYHRFHNLNVVLNIKPAQRYNIAVRFGFASGTPLAEVGDITARPVLLIRGSHPQFILKYKRANYYSDTKRNGFALPLDIKLSFFTFTKAGKTQGEMYLAGENILAFLKTRTTNTSFDEWTGKEVEGSDTANYQMPVPMISFGFTWSY